MATPTTKAPAIEQLLGLMGKDRRGAILADRCVDCECDAREFRDALSEREYSISGLCQSCQDAVFGDGEHEE